MSSVVIKGNTSGQVTLDAPAIAGTVTVTLPSVSGTMATNANGDLYPLTSGTSVASTSGTSIDFTSIPSWVKRITVMFNGVSTSGSSPIQIQLGAGSVTTTGYLSASSFISSSVTTANSTTGLIVANNRAAADLQHGSAIISGFGSNTWVMQSLLGTTSGASAITTTGGGSIALSGTLDRIRITTVNGTDTFDAGSINILYE